MQTAPLSEPTFGSMLRQMRIDRLISIPLLASAIGVNQSTIIYWEQGKRHPKRQHVAALCEAMGLSGYATYQLTREAGYYTEPVDPPRRKVTRRSGRFQLVEVPA